MASNRIGRINDEIRRELSELLRSVKDPRVSGSMLTITHVDTTTDLRYARVYVTALNRTGEKDLMKGLKSASGFLRREREEAASAFWREIFCTCISGRSKRVSCR